jgi:UDP-N-acetylmuramoyl-L-alanyl-D-glutamate--2,6-diaminopimelate ligase
MSKQAIETSKRLSQLCFEIKAGSDFDVLVSGLSLDSRHVRKGDVFFALAGDRFDAREAIPEVLTCGVAAIFCEANDTWRDSALYQGVPVIVVPDLTAKLGYMAANFHGRPSTDMNVLGITGTNGKTTCSWFVAQLAQLLGENAAVIGTLGIGGLSALKTTGFTTPDAVCLQSELAEFKRDRISQVAMEVSSHGLSMGRVNGTVFTSAVFTNLSHDHLDFHGTLEEYANVKASLFKTAGLQRAVINVDDPVGVSIAETASADELVLVSTREMSALKDRLLASGKKVTCWHIESITCSADGMAVELDTDGQHFCLNLPFLGIFNAWNAVYAIAALAQRPHDVTSLVQVATQLYLPPGRMTQVSVAQYHGVVDFAHTPDALESVLGALRPHVKNRLICVFGCGGDRDHSKRPLMGAIARSLADVLVITSDNPRGENPQNIIDDILSGIDQLDQVHVVEDRERAIAKAVELADTDDLILVAGKGHEDYQEIQGVKVPFEDAHLLRHYFQGEGHD